MAFLAMFCFLCFSLLLRVQRVHGDLFDTHELKIGKQGFTVRLTCTTNSGRPVDWEHTSTNVTEPTHVYDGSQGVIHKSDAYVEINRTGQYDLIIRNVDPSDAGTYTCIEDKDGGDRKSVELVVLEHFTCNLFEPATGAMGENVFGLSQTLIRLSCRSSFAGNSPLVPKCHWVDDDDGDHDDDDDDDDKEDDEDGEDDDEEEEFPEPETSLTPTSATSNYLIVAVKELQGTVISCDAVVGDEQADSDWTSNPVKVNYAIVSKVDVEECPDVDWALECSPACSYTLVDYDNGTCECLAKYSPHSGESHDYSIEYECDDDDARPSSVVSAAQVPLYVPIVITILALAVLFLGLLFIVIVMRNKKAKKRRLNAQMLQPDDRNPST